jgi:hypothetical protein
LNLPAIFTVCVSFGLFCSAVVEKGDLPQVVAHQICNNVCEIYAKLLSGPRT